MRFLCACVIGANLAVMFAHGSADPIAVTLTVIAAYLLGTTKKKSST